MATSPRMDRWLKSGTVAAQSPELVHRRGRTDHVVILDGTLSTLDEGRETNAGLTFRLLAELAPRIDMSLFYEAGLQWQRPFRWSDVITGHGLDRQIRRAYGFLASRYRPGDRIFLVGYSRGAYAVRSLAGMIDRVGLLKADCATVRNIRQAWRHYRDGADGAAARAFAAATCEPGVAVEAVAVWETVKALGLRLPLVWKLTEPVHAFHNHHLGPATRHGFHALALDETRDAFAPVMWSCPPDWRGHVEQVWFRGSHADIGGHIGSFHAARPLANIPLVWMLGRLQECGLVLPLGWRERFPCDPAAPSTGSWGGLGKLFLIRSARVVGQDVSERLHPTALIGRRRRPPPLPVLTDQSSRIRQVVEPVA